MIEFILQHQFWAAVVAYWLFSAAVSAMPEPGDHANPAYLWFYRFLHTTAGNITTAFGSRIPALKPFIPPALLLPVLLAMPACAATHYTVHPGSLNTTDSVAYDTLLFAKASIDQARADNKAHPFNPEAREALNTLIQSYNVARESWLTYRGAISANEPSTIYLAELKKNLTDLTNAIRNFTTEGR